MKISKFLSICAILTCILASGCSKANVDNPNVQPSDDDTQVQNESTDGTDKATGTIKLSDEELYDKLLGGWIGQMVGVSWAASTEFRWCGEIIPENEFPLWTPSMVNDAFGQDDLYVEIPFLDAMKEHGADCEVKYLAEKFRDSQFPLWHANYQGRLNLRNGIEYPDSGSYLYNYHADDIDWQIECDFLGMMYPGLVNESAKRSFDVGHIMNYGDGVYGGVFITAMHSAAYTAETIMDIVDAGLAVIPEGTLFKDVMNDVMESYNNGDTWEENWQKLEDKWAATDKCLELSGVLNIDAKLNSAYVLIGMLYGEGDIEKTIVISGRCGQDSDCNPSSAASILGNFYGASKMDDKYKSALDYTGRMFSHTSYNLNDVLELNFGLMKDVLTQNNVKYDDGTWTLTPAAAYEPVEFEQWPDGISAMLNVTPTGGKSVKISLQAFGSEKVKSVSYNMGDGFETNAQPVLYTYSEAGEYTVTCTVTGENGSEVTARSNISVEDSIPIDGHAICSVTAPTGGGNKDVSVIYDGIVPAAIQATDKMQYDTYCGGQKSDFVYAGIEFDCTGTLTGVKFTEGNHFHDGGWFAETPAVEVLINNEWVSCEASVSPEYPTGGLNEHGSGYETYTFTLKEETECDGVRISGTPGGNAYFISVSEITPIVSAVQSDNDSSNADSTIVICSVSNPTGGGSSDIGVICDGIVPSATAATDKMQYDTYCGTNPGADAYIGYIYRSEREVSEVVFTEGNHFNNGGWFKNGEIYVEALINGEWVRTEYAASPEYPNGDSQNVFGSGYQTYTFTLNKPVNCTGIRLYGACGGYAGFISVSELEIK